MLNGLDLFSGIGGISIALEPWVRPVVYCENDGYAQAVLLSRMRQGDIHRAPIWDDVRTLYTGLLPGIDIIYGGFPCQDISVAGNGAGLAGGRSGLYFHVERLVREVAPTFVFLENVPAIRTRGGERVVKGLAGLGYDCRWTTLSAAEVGANHKRERWFLLAANPKRLELWDEQGRSCRTSRDGQAVPRNNGETKSLANSESIGRSQGRSESEREQRGFIAPICGPQMADAKSEGWRRFGAAIGSNPKHSKPCPPAWWATEPDVGRVAHGVPQRVDRVRALGNAVVPLQAQTAFKRLMGLE